MSSTSNNVPTTPRASRASGRTLQKTESELEDAQREIQLLRSELESVKLEKEELAETSRLHLLERDEHSRALKDVKGKYASLKKKYKDLKKFYQEVKQDLGLELKAKTDAMIQFIAICKKYEQLEEEHQDAQEQIKRLEDASIALNLRLAHELERRQAEADVASQALVLHEAQVPPVQTPIFRMSVGHDGTVVFSTTTSVSLQTNNV